METTTRKYLEDQYTKLFERLSCFFAFSNEQFKEGIEKFGGIEKTGKYTNIGAGLVCPSKNVNALLNGMADIKMQWEKDRKEAEQIKLQFVGIDNWNRPVWKAPDQRAYFGSVNELFDYNTTEEEVRKKVDTYELCYFGDHFGCEPMGSNVPDKYFI